MIEEAKRKLHDEAKDSRRLKMMAMQTCELIDKTGDIGMVLASDKSLKGLEKIFDDFASKHKEGNKAVILPDEAEEMICEYFGIHDVGQPAPGKVIDIMDLL